MKIKKTLTEIGKFFAACLVGAFFSFVLLNGLEFRALQEQHLRGGRVYVESIDIYNCVGVRAFSAVYRVEVPIRDVVPSRIAVSEDAAVWF